MNIIWLEYSYKFQRLWRCRMAEKQSVIEEGVVFKTQTTQDGCAVGMICECKRQAPGRALYLKFFYQALSGLD